MTGPRVPSHARDALGRPMTEHEDASAVYGLPEGHHAIACRPCLATMTADRFVEELHEHVKTAGHSSKTARLANESAGHWLLSHPAYVEEIDTEPTRAQLNAYINPEDVA